MASSSVSPVQSNKTARPVLAEFRVAVRPMVAVILGMWASYLPGYSIGAFIRPVSEDLGISLTAAAGWMTAFSTGGIVAAPLLGSLADRIGARGVILCSLLLLGITMAGVGFLTGTLSEYYAGAATIGVLVAGASAITHGRIVGSMFNHGLGTALGLMSTGVGLAALTGPSAAQAVISAYGWRAGFIAIGAVQVPVLLVGLFWLRGRRVEPNLLNFAPEANGLSRAQAMRMPAFWIIGAGAIVYGLCVSGVATNLIPYLVADGLTPRAAAAWASLFGASTLLGRLTGGMIIDRFRIHAALLMAIVMAAESVAFIALGAYGAAVLIVALPVFGLAVGAEADCLAYCILRIFGRRYFGTIFAVLGYLLLYIGTGLGAVLFSATRDLFDSYEKAFYVWAGLAFLCVPLFLAVARTPFFVPATDATGDRGACSR